MYRERPSSLPAAYVWTSTVTPAESRILPDGCIDLIWDGRTVLIAGPDRTAHTFTGAVGQRLTGLRFAPGFAPRVLGLPAHELVDSRIALGDVWSGATVRRINEQLAEADDPGVRLEQISRTQAPESVDPLMDRITHLARARQPVDVIADEVGFSARQLQRRCQGAYGYGVKTLTRILRLNAALDLVRDGVAAGDSAARSGYADQSHFSRDVKELAGIPLGQLIPARSAPSPQA